MPKPNSFGTMGTVDTQLSSDFTPPDIKKKKEADLPQIAGMLPGHKINKPMETDVIPVINKGIPRIPSFKPADKPATPKNLTMKGQFPMTPGQFDKENPSAGPTGYRGMGNVKMSGATASDLRSPAGGDQDRTTFPKDPESPDMGKGFPSRKPGGNFSAGDKVAVKGSDAHPGFNAVASKIAGQYGGNKKIGAAIAASAARKASPAAKAKNPNLNKVKGEAKQKGFEEVEEKGLVRRVGNAATGAAGGTLMGGTIGAVGGAVGADKGKRWEGAKAGAKRGAPIGAAIGATQGSFLKSGDSAGTAIKRQMAGDPREINRILEHNKRLGHVAGAAVTGGAGYAGYKAGKNNSESENKQLTKEFEMSDRGNASYVEMKEFMNAEFVEKGGTSPETLPADRGDSAADDQLKNVMKKKQPPKGGLKTDAPDLTFADDVAMVGDKAEDDITSGYVGDTQGAKVGGGKKGFDAFNEMVAKGIVADVNINRYNVHESVAKVNEVADMELKGCAAPMEATKGKKKSPSLVETKGVVGRLGNRAGLAGATAVGNVGKYITEHPTKSAAMGAGAGGYIGGHIDQYSYQKQKARKAKAAAEAEANKEG